MKKETQRKTFTFELEVRFLVSVILCVSMYLIAASIGSGWVLFLSAAVMACAIVSVAVPLFFLSNLKATAHAPETAIEGELIQIRPQLECSNKFVAANCKLLILTIAPLPHTVFRRSQKMLSPQEDNGANTEQSESVLAESIDPPPKFTMTSPALRRGKHRLPPLEICSSYPLGLAWVRALFYFDQEIVVLPRTLTLEGNFIHKLKSSSFAPGDSHSVNTGYASAASRGVRNYVRGDSRRHIHWNLSARHGQLMVKERENEGIPAFDLVFDLGGNWQNKDQFDLAVSTAASVLKFGNNMGIHPELFILPKDYTPGQALPEKIVELDQQMRRLACIDTAAGALGQEPARDYSSLLHRAKAVVVITSSSLTGKNTSGKEAEKKTRGANSETNLVWSASQSSGNRIDPRSRSSLFLINVSAQPGGSAHIENGFCLSTEEELCRL